MQFRESAVWLVRKKIVLSVFVRGTPPLLTLSEMQITGPQCHAPTDVFRILFIHQGQIRYHLRKKDKKTLISTPPSL